MPHGQNMDILFPTTWTGGWERGENWDRAEEAIDDNEVLAKDWYQGVLLAKRESTAIDKSDIVSPETLLSRVEERFEEFS